MLLRDIALNNVTRHNAALEQIAALSRAEGAVIEHTQHGDIFDHLAHFHARIIVTFKTNRTVANANIGTMPRKGLGAIFFHRVLVHPVDIEQNPRACPLMLAGALPDKADEIGAIHLGQKCRLRD